MPESLEPDNNNFNVMLLLTLGGSLEAWHNAGHAARELRYYGLIAQKVKQVSVLTYGFKDYQYKETWSPIRILHRLGCIQHYYKYAVVAPFYYWRAFRQANIVKSNQSIGSLVALVGKMIRPSLKMVVRCGWVRTKETIISEQKKSGLSLKVSLFAEWLAFNTANAVITVTESDAQYIVDHYHVNRSKITVVPNAVDEDILFYRIEPTDLSSKIRILLVGRLVEMKNFDRVIDAAAAIDRDIEISIAGEGPLRNQLNDLAQQKGVSVTFLGSVENDEMVHVYHRHDLLLLTEAWGSGMPKVLLEAMSAGIPILASRTRSAQQIMRNEENGFCCNAELDDQIRALNHILSQPVALIERIREQARRDVEQKYSMKSCVEQELALYRRLLVR